MKPNTKEKVKLAKWVEAMPPITQHQLDYGIQHCFNNEVVLESRGWMWCVATNKVWHENAKAVKLYSKVKRPETDYKKMDVIHSTKDRNRKHFVVLTTKGGYQMAKWYCLDRWLYIGKIRETPKVEYSCMLVGVEFIAPKGQRITFSRDRCTMCWEKDRWSYWNDTLTLRRKSEFAKYLSPNAVLALSITPILKRNGWSRKLMDRFSDSEIELCQGLLKSQLFEQCVKAGHYGVCWGMMQRWYNKVRGYYSNSNKEFDDSCKVAIKLANRHHVKFDTTEKWNDFKDYLKDLIYLGKDIHNPAILFPADFQKEHMRLMRVAQKRRDEEARRAAAERNLQRMKEKAERDRAVQKWVNEYSQRFADMDIRMAEFEVKPLITKEDFMAEAAHMHHCIVTYYGKPNTLLLSIEHDGQKAETAEVNLIGNGTIIQCRGQYNHPSEWHNEIIKILKEKLPEFIKRGQRKMQLATLPVLATHYKNQLVA